MDGLLADPYSPESLRDALRRFLAEPGLRARLSAAAPAVKRIEDDAAEWDARYISLREGNRGPRIKAPPGADRTR